MFFCEAEDAIHKYRPLIISHFQNYREKPVVTSLSSRSLLIGKKQIGKKIIIDPTWLFGQPGERLLRRRAVCSDGREDLDTANGALSIPHAITSLWNGLLYQLYCHVLSCLKVRMF